MTKNINAYFKKRIVDDTWYLNSWYIGGYMYAGLSKWTDNAFFAYSAIGISFFILVYSIYITVLIYQSVEGNVRKKLMLKACFGIILSIALVIYTQMYF